MMKIHSYTNMSITQKYKYIIRIKKVNSSSDISNLYFKGSVTVLNLFSKEKVLKKFKESQLRNAWTSQQWNEDGSMHFFIGF